MKIIKTVIIIFCFTNILNAQIPNGGFENWIDDITPNDWTTTNFASAWTNTSKSSDAYSGSSAAKLEVADFNGIPVYPSLNIIFPVNQAYGALTGYYQLHQANNEVILGILAYYFVNGNIVGGDILELGVSTSTYLPFSINLVSEGVTPDSMFIQMTVLTNDAETGIGAFALVDDLSFGEAQPTDVKRNDQIPTEFSLKQNYPNPFNPSTSIEFSVPTESLVELKIFNTLGKEVVILANENYAAGSYKANFDGSNLPSGIYFARMKAGNFVQTNKMILMK